MYWVNILWDFDGTLFDTYPSFVNYVKKKGSGDKKTIYQDFKRGARYTFEKYNVPGPFKTSMEEVEKTTDPKDTPPFPYVEEVLKVATNNVIVTNKGRKAVEKILDYYDMRHYFKEIICRDDRFQRKTEPSSYQHIHKKYKVDLVIGDRELDMFSAKELGIKTCLFRSDACTTDYKLDDYHDFFMIILAELFNKKVGIYSPFVVDEVSLQKFFYPTEDRYKHIVEVAKKSQYKEAAYLHDIGYAVEANQMGFHPLDGALYALENGFSSTIIKAVMYHSSSHEEALVMGGLFKEVYEKTKGFLTEKDKRVIEEVTYHDLTTSKDGRTVSFEERIREIEKRHTEGTMVNKALKMSYRRYLTIIGKHGKIQD